MLAAMTVTSMLDREVYVYAEVDRLIGLRGGTARRWINGYERSGKDYPPILRVTPRDTPWVTWGEFVETRMLHEFRDFKKVPIPRLRAAIDELRRVYGTQYPLAHMRPYLSSHDRDLTIRDGSELETVIRTGQQLIGDGRWLAERSTLENDEDGEAIIVEIPADRDFPDIVINPVRYSGQPTFVGRRVSPVTIAGMANSGEPHEVLAAEYGLSLKQVDQAIAYTERYGLAAA
ncbi:DUF433 domain-containing protein [Mycobacterium intracellulare subsp. intracellulare]|uniref:DUF433 domain-containing protein n=1 Tax=Mycobacterium intracellulare TaxID=1767 RepID=UPI0001B4575B|nr:DUF433 domain-containing protein [Mycobacterium intracellulare]UGU08143.1 DUF433 domain-containing protein [Mycobacterium intracellulare subsp. intracellulare]BCO57164.1 hypothetical protein MINTM005_24080 [Mycobacterium intracellulare]BCO94268.1 hypothetical protein MINTM016_22440 [Mycobacterium intracellulare]